MSQPPTYAQALADAGIAEPIVGDSTVLVTGIQIDSRRVAPGDIFVAMPSTNRDSHAFLGTARSAGAVAAIVYSLEGLTAARELGLAAAHLVPDRYPDRIWRLADVVLAHPTRTMRVIGVTGTNGKTTVAWLLRDLLAATGLTAGYMGTLGLSYPGHIQELPNTTPFAVDLYNYLDQANRAGVQALAMEVSSHALDQRRADGVEFDAAIYTNLTQDHLDYHPTMADYARAKARLFLDLPKYSAKPFVAAFNIDDPEIQRFAHEFTGSHIKFSTRTSADLTVTPLEVLVDRIRFRAQIGQDQLEAEVPLGGSYNVENLASACAGMVALGFRLSDLASAMSGLRPVPGRFEAVSNGRGIGILVDYAHTPDAIEKVLAAARPLTHGRLITVFGCGGDRDRAKRPLMAAAAARSSDLVIVTSDNPRTEDPQEIAREVAAGLPPGADSATIIDRAEAVAYAVRHARPGDTVVIAGKGHENYQIIGREKYPMDDRLLAQEALAS